MNLLTTKEVAERLSVSMKRVQAMIRAGRLPAEKFGRDYLVREPDLAIVADRKSGRPPNPTPASNGQKSKTAKSAKRRKTSK